MRPVLFATAALLLLGSPSAFAQSTRFNGEVPQDATMSVLTTGLSNPFEIVYGPDGRLWATERTAGRITRVDPSDGSASALVEIDEVVITEGTQDGLLGLALATLMLGMLGAAMPQFFGALRADGTVWMLGIGAIVALALAVGLPPALRAGRLKIVDALSGH